MVGGPRISVGAAGWIVLVLAGWMLVGPAAAQVGVPSVDDQKDLVQRLLASGQSQRALAEAKRYYHMVPLRQTRQAVELLALALEQTTGPNDPTVVAWFLDQQSEGACTSRPKLPVGQNILKQIKLDGSPYAAALDKSRSAASYEQLMYRGDLLLLADRPVEARQAFLAAAHLPGIKDKRLFAAVEGVARALRAEHGMTGPANALVVSLMLGEVEPARQVGFEPQRWKTGELQVAGQRVILRQLCRLGPESEPAALDQEESEGEPVSGESPGSTPGGRWVQSYDCGDPLVVASVVPQPDAALVAWLKRWQDQMLRHGQRPVCDAHKAELFSILRQTKLSCMVLFHLGHAYQFRTNNDPASALFYQAGAKRVEGELQALGRTPQGAAVVRSMKDHMGGFRRVLWPLIARGDNDAAEALYAIYTSYVRWVPPGDRALNKPVTHLKVGAAQVRYVQGRAQDVVSMLDSIDAEEIKRAGLEASVNWYRGLALYQTGRYDEAIPKLAVCAQSKSAVSEQARRNLVGCLINLGRHDEANRYLEQWRNTGLATQAELQELDTLLWSLPCRTHNEHQ